MAKKAKLGKDESIIVAVLSELDKLGPGILDDLLAKAEASEFVKAKDIKTRYEALLIELLTGKKAEAEVVAKETEIVVTLTKDKKKKKKKNKEEKVEAVATEEVKVVVTQNVESEEDEKE